MDIKNSTNRNKRNIHKVEAWHDLSSESSNQDTCEIMLIGFFDSPDQVARLIADYEQLPGFSLPDCKFCVVEYAFDVCDTQSIDEVYYVQDWLYNSISGEEKSNEVGLYLTMEEAEQAERYYQINCPAVPRGFQRSIIIDKYIVNRRYWSEGFVTV